MRDVLAEVDAWTARGDRVALATVVGIRFSAPRPLGAKLAISSSGDVAGAVSGGCVEASVIREAGELLAGRGPAGRLRSYGIADDEAWEVGLPCGGEIDVWIDLHEDDALAGATRTGGRAARVTVLDGPAAGRRLHVDAAGRTTGTLGGPALDVAADGAAELVAAGRCAVLEAGGARLFVDVVRPDPRLVVVGAGDLARHLCAVARTVGWRTVVVDPRSLFARPERFPDADATVDRWPQEAFPLLGVGADDAVVVLTHDPKLDDAAILAALAAGAGFVGAMGSRHAQTMRRRRLHEHGVPDDEVARIAGPVGLDLGATATPETALSILAEVVADRHGRDGGRLRHAAGRIHELR
ncbi:XdhC family protein [Patulibacter sp. NPDC049589]|uniref:XdhC family protein n=1 Tax=Patulibacter sp. NPDC049589 TaxID=3154731 RepID=UPI0034171467